jgi:hypothetical protein
MKSFLCKVVAMGSCCGERKAEKAMAGRASKTTGACKGNVTNGNEESQNMAIQRERNVAMATKKSPNTRNNEKETPQWQRRKPEYTETTEKETS